MTLVDRYIGGSFFKIFLATVCICALLLVAVDLFSHLDAYITNDVPALIIIRLTLLYIPEALTMVISPAVIFGATLSLALLHSTNEIIPLFCAGISYVRILVSLLIIGVVISICLWLGNEYVAIPTKIERMELQTEYTGSKENQDNRNITFVDANGQFVLHAKRYNAQSQRISDLIIIERDMNGRMKSRTAARSAVWDSTQNSWNLENVFHQIIDDRGQVVVSSTPRMLSTSLQVEPELFANLTTDMKTIARNAAIWYLNNMKVLDVEQWATAATEYYERLYNFLVPMALMLISCSLNYKYKKNVLLFSLINSIAIAVVFYVLQMVTLLLAKQFIIPPLMGVLFPIMFISITAGAFFLRLNRV